FLALRAPGAPRVSICSRSGLQLPPDPAENTASAGRGDWRTGCIVVPPSGGHPMANTSAGETAAIELMQRVSTPAEAPRGDRTPEGLADLFAPDIVLPEQFFEGARRDSYISGEK